MADLFEQLTADASFAGVYFPVALSSFEFGHDSADYSTYLSTGVDIQPTGVKGDTGVLTVPMYNDLNVPNQPLYPRQYNRLCEAIRANPLGELVHPLEGTFEVMIEVVKVTTHPDKRNGVELELKWKRNYHSLSEEAPQGETSPTAISNSAQSFDSLLDQLAATGGLRNPG